MTRRNLAAMDATTAALGLARGRIAFGVAALAAPRRSARVMGAGRRPRATVVVLTRMVGGRDLALGLGTMIAIDRGKPVRGWLEGSALADAADCAACILSHGELPRNVTRATVAIAGVSAIAGIVLSRRLDPPAVAHP